MKTRPILQKPLTFSGIKRNPLKQIVSYLEQTLRESNERALPNLSARAYEIKRLESRKVKQETNFAELHKIAF